MNQFQKLYTKFRPAGIRSKPISTRPSRFFTVGSHSFADVVKDQRQPPPSLSSSFQPKQTAAKKTVFFKDSASNEPLCKAISALNETIDRLQDTIERLNRRVDNLESENDHLSDLIAWMGDQLERLEGDV